MRRPIARVLAGIAAASILFVSCQVAAEEQVVPLPTGAPFPPEMEPRLAAIRERQLRIRGLTLDSPVDESTLTRDELRAYFDQVEAEVEEDERAQMEIYNKAWRLLRLIGPNDDLLTLLTDSDSEDILGFFAFEHGRLVLISDKPELTQDDEFTLAHEYVHSFQHKAFDTERLHDLEAKEKPDAATEYSTTISCLKEGDATLASVLYAREAFGEAYFDNDEPPDPAEPPDTTPPALERYQAFNYDECATWAVALWRENGLNFGEIDRAYARPPQTTEQILHPEKYRAGETATGMKPIDITKRLGKSWERLESSIYGEFDLWNYLYTVIGDETLAGLAAHGWGVGWGNIYSEKLEDGADGAVLVHLQLEFDSKQDLGEFLVAYSAVLEKIAPGAIRSAPDKATTCWDLLTEAGYIGWNDTHKRADIVIASTADARNKAIAGSLSVATSGSCPA